MKRRAFLRYSSAGIAAALAGTSGVFLWQPRAYAANINKTFYITDGLIEQPDGVDVYFRGFSKSSNTLTVPGASFIVQEGDTVNITIVNTLGTSHSFVIDGMVDSGTIRGGESKTIQFTASNTGTHMFYDSLNAPYNRILGLHGGMAVMPDGSADELYSGSPSFVQQYFWVFNDTDPAWNSRLQMGLTPNTEFKPRYFTINGLSSRPPGSQGYATDLDAMHEYHTALHGHVGDRTLIRILNPGKCYHSVHWHANHVEWLTKDGEIRDDVWKKDTIRLSNNNGLLDVIYPFEAPPDAYPRVTKGMFPMHLHDEMSQTAGGGSYMFGAMTEIIFE